MTFKIKKDVLSIKKIKKPCKKYFVGLHQRLAYRVRVTGRGSPKISDGKKFMIAYDLQCVNGHSFEGWFEDRNAYETQKKKALIACPVCSSTSIARVPSTFAIKSSNPYKQISEQQADLGEISHKIVEFVEKNFDDVGADFAKEALKMHYGVTEARNIRGVSTKEEEKTLKEEGIQFFKVPMPEVPDTDA